VTGGDVIGVFALRLALEYGDCPLVWSRRDVCLTPPTRTRSPSWCRNPHLWPLTEYVTSGANLECFAVQTTGPLIHPTGNTVIRVVIMATWRRGLCNYHEPLEDTATGTRLNLFGRQFYGRTRDQCPSVNGKCGPSGMMLSW